MATPEISVGLARTAALLNQALEGPRPARTPNSPAEIALRPDSVKLNRRNGATTAEVLQQNAVHAEDAGLYHVSRSAIGRTSGYVFAIGRNAQTELLSRLLNALALRAGDGQETRTLALLARLVAQLDTRTLKELVTQLEETGSPLLVRAHSDAHKGNLTTAQLKQFLLNAAHTDGPAQDTGAAARLNNIHDIPRTTPTDSFERLLETLTTLGFGSREAEIVAVMLRRFFRLDPRILRLLGILPAAMGVGAGDDDLPASLPSPIIRRVLIELALLGFDGPSAGSSAERTLADQLLQMEIRLQQWKSLLRWYSARPGETLQWESPLPQTAPLPTPAPPDYTQAQLASSLLGALMIFAANQQQKKKRKRRRKHRNRNRSGRNQTARDA